MENSEKNIDNIEILTATKNLNDFVKKVNYIDAQHEVFDVLKKDLMAMRIRRIFKLVFLIVLGVFVFFVQVSFPYVVEIAFKIFIMFCIAAITDVVFIEKLDVGRLQSRLFLVTLSTNLMFVNEEIEKLKKEGVKNV